MTVCTFVRRWFIEKDRFAVNHSRFLVTFVAGDLRVASRKREVRSRVVIKSGRNPALDVVAVPATGLTSLCELGSVRIRVAVFADLRGSLELSLAGAGRGFVTCGAGNGAMCAKERELGFRMIETAHVRP